MGRPEPSARGGTRYRSMNNRDPVPTILIVCEGEATEPNYFKGFPVSTLRVEVEGTGDNTTSLVHRAIQFAKKKKYDQVWCVFDRDSFGKEAFNNAIQQAQAIGFRVAWSNECFELWYVLHFGYLDSGQSRTLFEPRLTRCLGHKYIKNSIAMYEELLPNQEAAIRNAKKLHTSQISASPADQNPCTTVYELVEELNRHIR